MKVPIIDRRWTLFLDRDGVLNRQRIDDYVKSPEEFEWLPGVLEALQILRPLFGHLIVVTNQQGVGKGLMSQGDLDLVHDRLREQAASVGVQFEAIYACTALIAAQNPDRKPAPGMAFQAQLAFPAIDFLRSVMVGDSPSDLGFGESLGMYCVGVGARVQDRAHLHVSSLLEFAQQMVEAQRLRD